jgi:hypothetical protein
MVYLIWGALEIRKYLSCEPLEMVSTYLNLENIVNNLKLVKM